VSYRATIAENCQTHRVAFHRDGVGAADKTVDGLKAGSVSSSSDG
jgi:hypothetical protein